MTEKPVTLESIIRQVIDALEGPTALDDVVQQVLAIRPSKARNPVQSVRNHIRQLYRPSWVWLDEKTLVPLRFVMQGVRFRISLSRVEVERGILYTTPAFNGFMPDHRSLEDIQLVDAANRNLPVDLVTIQEKGVSIFGDDYLVYHKGFHLEAWFKQVGFRRKDSILVTIEDWEMPLYRLEHEPADKQRRSEIAQKNQEMADLFFSMLEQARNESIPDQVAVHSVYARMSEPGGYPGNHWIEVVEQDARMKWIFGDIRYFEAMSPFETILGEAPAIEQPRISPKEGRQAYCFKAAFKHQPGIWRRIQIQGKQTLEDFDNILREVFDHDTSDHLSGFWKRVRRGESRRFREINLGSINPFGEGEAASLQIAGLALQPGDELKYVYDFGDWIEHTITLEEIAEPEAEASYPRVVERNKPKYSDCERCESQGRQTVAIWICHDCSRREQRAVLICDQCADDAHEDHYLERIIY